MRTAVSWIIWCTVGASAAAAETVTFTLNPELGKEMRAVSTTTVAVFGDAAHPQPAHREERRGAQRLLMAGSGGQYALTMRVDSLAVTVNGEAQPVTAEGLLQQHPVSLVFDAQGRLSGLQGVEALAAALAPAGGSREQLEASLRRAWVTGVGGRVWARLAGQEAAIGKTWERRDTLDVAAVDWATVPVRGVWTYLGPETPGAADRARLQYDYTSDTVPLSDDGVPVAQAWLAARVPALAGVRWQSVQVDNQGELIVAPTSLTCYRWDDLTRLTIAAADPALPAARIEVSVTMRLAE